MELVPVSKETGLDPGAKRGLQEKLKEREASTTITPTPAPPG
jgi:hypothetical protein